MRFIWDLLILLKLKIFLNPTSNESKYLGHVTTHKQLLSDHLRQESQDQKRTLRSSHFLKGVQNLIQCNKMIRKRTY